jgi:REP element-mobilizing transposase RayT
MERVVEADMPRSIRIEYPGAYYHVMARGNRREAIFLDETDRAFYLKTLGDACARTGWRVHAWVFMGNHYHLFVETPEANLVEGMKWLQNAYTRRFNSRHRLWGRLFADRYKAMAVEGDARYYYETLMDYIHLNPVRAGLIDPGAGQSVLDFPWSSIAQGYALPPGKRSKWLAAETGLSVFGFGDTAKGRRGFVERLDRRASAEKGRAGAVASAGESDAGGGQLRRGWHWGTQAFAERLMAIGRKALGKRRERGYRASLEAKAHDLRRAEEILAAGLEAAGLGAEEIRRLPGSDVRKVSVARAIWESTTVSQSWLAEHLGMSSAANVSQLLCRARHGSLEARLPPALRRWVKSVKK